MGRLFVLPYDSKNHDWPQVCIITVASLGALTCSAFFTWTSPSIPILISNSSHMDVISLGQASYLAIIPPLTAIIFAPLISLMIDIIGRKKTIWFMAIPHITAWIIKILARNIYLIYIARALTGVSDAILFGAIPTYVGEIATPKVRGSWGNLIAVSIYFGQFLINLVGAYVDILITAEIFICLPILQMILMAFVPESPYFLIMKGKHDEANESLKKLRWNNNVVEELKTIHNDVERQLSEPGSIKDLFIWPTNRKALLISIAIRGCQQFSGLPAFAVYTQYMFKKAGGNITASTSAIVYTGTLLILTTAASFLVDRLGRKTLMTFSCLSCSFVLATEATYFYLDNNTAVDVSHFRSLPLIGMLLYIIFCSSGLAIIPTLMLGELFSASIKSKALGVLNIAFAMYTLFVAKMFQSMTFYFGMCTPFYLFSVCCFVGAIFSYFFVPETKGKTLEEIQQELKGKEQSKDIQLSTFC